MRTLRVANINHASALPYRLLADVGFIRYEENSAAENGLRLHEGEVDVALISVAEFAMHGGYVGLDFGIGCKGRSDTLMLYSQAPLDEVETVNIYSAASSTALLLRMMLSKFWRVSPLLIRRKKSNLLDYVGGKDAALVFHEAPEPLSERYPVAIDLVKVWGQVTGKPYVSSVWAVRPGVLKPEHLRSFNDVFHRASKARGSIATLHAGEEGIHTDRLVRYVTECLDYYFDVPMIEGLELFLREAAESNLLPASRYRSATLTLIGRHVPRMAEERSVPQILEGVLDGARLGIRDGIRLAYEASIGDLTLVADTIRKRVAPEQLVRQVATVSLSEERAGRDPLPRVLNEIKSVVDAGVLQIRLTGASRVTYDPDFWCRMLRRIKQRFPILIEALSAFEIHWMGSVTGNPPEQLVSGLVAAGLDIVGGDGGEMLVDRVMAEGLPGFSSVHDWLSSMRWVHRFGGTSRAVMRLSRHDSWEDRLLHLHKLRTLQDEMPGIRSFCLKAEPEGGERVAAEIKLRCTALARIFLDNLQSIEECELLEGESTAAALSLGAGVREVRVAGTIAAGWYGAIVDNFQHVGITLTGDPGQFPTRR